MKNTEAGNFPYYTWGDGSQRSLPQPPGLWLASTHWTPAKAPFDPTDQTATVIYPRPDDEIVNPNAFHRNHYYDGVTNFTQTIPLLARGGAAPINYVIMAAPAAANARMGASQWTPGWTLAQAVAAGYGDLLITPSGNYANATFWIRAYGQDFNYVEWVFTASTTSSNDIFQFIDPVSGSDTNNGTVGSPIQTLTQAYGATPGTTTYPWAILVARGTGSLFTFPQNGDYGIEITPNASPMSIIGMPGDPLVTFDATNAATDTGHATMAWTMADGCSGVFLQNFQEINGPTGTIIFRHFFTDGITDQFTAQNISFPNVVAGTDPTDNSSSFVFEDPGTTSWRSYIGLKGCSETNRPGPASNSSGLYDLFRTQYFISQFCSLENCQGSSGFDIGHHACQDITVEYCYAQATASPITTGQACYRCEFRYNTLVAVNASTSSTENTQLAYCGPHWWYRNSCYNSNFWVKNPTTGVASPTQTNGGPFTHEDNAIQYTTVVIDGVTGPVLVWEPAGVWTNVLPPQVTNSGVECQAQTGVFDGTLPPTTSQNAILTGSYASYVGTRGAVIG